MIGLRVVGFGGLIVFAVVVGLHAPSAWAIVIDRIVAVVNKDIITLSQVQEVGKGEFTQLQQRYNGRRLKREIERVQRKYLDLLITRRLRVNRAKEIELSFTDAEVDRALEDVKKRHNISDNELVVLLKREGMTIPEYRERVGEEILLRKVMNIEVRSRISVTPREIEAYYASHRSEFLPPERIHASHILFLASITASPDVERAKRTAAERVLRRIHAGAGFSEMAKRYSQDPSAARGGDLGIIRRSEVLPNFERVLFAMKEGEVSDVVRTRAGFHIIRLVKRLPRISPSIDKVEKKIRSQIFQKKVATRMRRWMEELKKKAYIEVTM